MDVADDDEWEALGAVLLVAMLPTLGASIVATTVFFFFQAEDGIRDTSVTGVQTCALPISSSCGTAAWARMFPLSAITTACGFVPSRCTGAGSQEARTVRQSRGASSCRLQKVGDSAKSFLMPRSDCH